MIPGIAILGSKAPKVNIVLSDATIKQVTSGTPFADPQTFDFSPSAGVALAAADRLIFFVYAGTHDDTISGVTIAGVAATKATQGGTDAAARNTTAAEDRIAEIWWAHVPTNGGGHDVSVDYSAAPAGTVSARATCFYVYGANVTTPISDAANATDSDTDVAAAVDVPERGGLIALVAGNSAVTSISWTNATESFETAAVAMNDSGAIFTTNDAAAARTVTATFSGTVESALAVCAIQPAS